MSAPTEKARPPAPCRTRQPTDWSAATSSRHSASSAFSWCDSGLRGGRLIVTVATRSPELQPTNCHVAAIALLLLPIEEYDEPAPCAASRRHPESGVDRGGGQKYTTSIS